MMKKGAISAMLFATVLLLGGCSTETDELQSFAPAIKPSGAALSDPKALYAYGLSLARGEGIKQDLAAAAEWFRQAADMGNADAQYQLGLLYGRGEGVSQDFVKARELLQKASMAGHPKAMYFYAEMHARGEGGPENDQEACIWYWLATSFGNKYAQKRLRAITPRISPEALIAAQEKAEELWEKIPHDRAVKLPSSMH